MNVTRSCVLASALAALSTGDALASAQEAVHINVSIEASFYDNKTDQWKADVELRLADKLTHLVGRKYPFLKMTTASSGLPELNVRLMEDSLATPPAGCSRRQVLRLFTRISSGIPEVDISPRGIVAFESCNTFADSASLLDRAVGVLDSALVEVDMRRDFEKGFVSLVAFADSISPSDSTVFLPGCDSLLLGGASKLSVLFAENSPSGNGENRTFLRLHDPSPHRSESTAPDGSKQTVEGYFLASTNDAPLRQLATAAAEDRVTEIQVFVTEYEHSIDCKLLRPGGNQPEP